MKPQFIITTISEKQCHYEPYKEVDFFVIPASISFDFEISVVGNGNFSDYLVDGVLNKRKIALDILQGKINIVGSEGVF